MKQKSMFLNLKNILHRDATDGCSAVISPKAPSERGLREAVEEIAQRAVQISLPPSHQIFLCTHSPSVACATAPSRKEPFCFFASCKKDGRRMHSVNRYFRDGKPIPYYFVTTKTCLVFPARVILEQASTFEILRFARE